MKHLLAFGFVASVGALGLAGCGETTTEVTKEVVPACSPTQPQGACAAGETCFEGACVASASLCSVTNLEGTCSSGMQCFAGGCILETTLCSENTPTGVCNIGETCLEGSCEATASLCSPSVPDGICPSGQTCRDGMCAGGEVAACDEPVYTEQPTLGFAEAVPTDDSGNPVGTAKSEITVDGLKFRDLSGDGALQKYEDWRYSAICRAKDLVPRMSVPEKTGLMAEDGRLGNATEDGSVTADVLSYIKDDHGRQGITRFRASALGQAMYFNSLQAIAETQPLGIPIATTADPAHSTSVRMAPDGTMTVSQSSLFTSWPGTLALTAMNNFEMTKAFGDLVRREFMAVGVRWELGPQIDPATEPRWSRVAGTLGANALAAAVHTKALVIGMQNSANGDLRNGIAVTLKHFAGYGAGVNGTDGHQIGISVFPGDNFDYHLIPFQAGFDVGAAAIMPNYTIPQGQFDVNPLQVPAAFSYEMITKLAKEQMGHSGLVTADWCTVSTGSCANVGIGGGGFGMETLSPTERAALFLHAGSHQVGNEAPGLMQTTYDEGLITEEEINAAAEKILEMSFKLGLFENPYVDTTVTATSVRTPESRTLAFEAQKRSIVLLSNADHANRQIRYLPINGTRVSNPGEYQCDTDGDGTVRVYYDGAQDSIVEGDDDGWDDLFGKFDHTMAGGTDQLPIAATTDITEADIAIIRIVARSGSQSYGAPLSFDGELTPAELGYGNDGT
ncbi:MAG: glycoside hydrolase family 3 N-terminal domain-containing protein, partial [Polyangiales bacterium]